MASKKQRLAAIESALRLAKIGERNLEVVEKPQEPYVTSDIVSDTVLKEWSFWTWEEREMISKELLACRAKNAQHL